MLRGRVLLVVPDEDLRRSLAFALETHGHAVTCTNDSLAETDMLAFDCIVLDERALRSEQSTDIRAMASAHRVILLSYGQANYGDAPFDRVVPMPLKGESVTDAVAATLAPL